MTLAKLYVRLVFRDEGPFDALKTQRAFSRPDPPRGLAKRCRRVQFDGVDSFWIDEENKKNGVLVYLHGGAFYFGPVKEHWDYIGLITKRTGMAALLVNYRKAPQHPFPAALDDIMNAVSGSELPENWFFLGDSSGAGKAVSAFFRLKQRGKSLPKKIVMMSPWIDATLSNPDISLNEHEDVMMTKKRLSNAARAYEPDGDLANPEISPNFRDISGLPPVLIQMGTADLLLADCRKFQEKCRDEGVDVKYEEFEGAFHDFMMLPFLPEAKIAIDAQVEFLCK
jgi:epsilon-lactone hydrolase